MNRLVSRFQLLSSTKQFLVARTLYDWAIYVFDMFYMTYIFKESGEVKMVVVNILVTLSAVFAGFVLSAVVIPRIGVERSFRLSFVMYLVTGLAGLYLGNIGVLPYVLISAIRGLAEGVFWATSNVVEFNGLPEDSRSRFYSVSKSINGVFDIVLPVILGYMLAVSNSLYPTFILFSAICAIAVFMPYKFEIKRDLLVKWKNFGKIVRSPRFGSFSLMKMTLSASWVIDWLLWALVPFIVLGGELNMGIYLTIASLVGVVVSAVTNRLKIEKKANLGGRLWWIGASMDLLLAIFLTPLMLYVNTIVYSVIESVLVPLEFDMSARITNVMDGNGGAGMELVLIQEAIYTIGRLAIGATVLVIISLGVAVLPIVKILIILIAITKLTNYYLSVSFLKLKSNG